MKAPVAIALAAFVLTKRWKSKRALRVKKKRRGNFNRGKLVWWQHLRNFANEAEFRRYYKITRSEFDDLCRQVEPFIATRSHKQTKTALCARVQLSITLRLLAGASYLDMMVIHKVAKATVYSVFNKVVSVLHQVLPPLKFPLGDSASLAELERGFTVKGPGGVDSGIMDGIVGAMDGIAIKIIRPRLRIDGVDNPQSYYNRKCFFALNVQAIVDSNKRFLWMSALHEGSTHDSTAYGSTSLARKLESDGFGGGRRYYLAGDDAYSSHEHVVTPWAGRGLTAEKDSFNFWLSHLRIHVECAFGELVQRWGILWRPLTYRLSVSIKVISVVMRLHNVCVGRRLADEVVRSDRTWGNVRSNTVPDMRWHSSSQIAGPQEGQRGGNRLRHSQRYRLDQTNHLLRHGILRPARRTLRQMYTISAESQGRRHVYYVPVAEL